MPFLKSVARKPGKIRVEATNHDVAQANRKDQGQGSSLEQTNPDGVSPPRNGRDGPDAKTNAQSPPRPNTLAKTSRRRRVGELLRAVPGWMVSAGLHGAILLALLSWKYGVQVNAIQARIDAAPLNTAIQEDEMIQVLSDPGEKRTDFVGADLIAKTSSPSATPNVSQAASAISERALSVDPTVQELAIQNPIATMPSAPSLDFAATPSGVGGIAGDVTRSIGTIDQALDQLAR